MFRYCADPTRGFADVLSISPLRLRNGITGDVMESLSATWFTSEPRPVYLGPTPSPAPTQQPPAPAAAPPSSPAAGAGVPCCPLCEGSVSDAPGWLVCIGNGSDNGLGGCGWTAGEARKCARNGCTVPADPDSNYCQPECSRIAAEQIRQRISERWAAAVAAKLEDNARERAELARPFAPSVLDDDLFGRPVRP